MDKKQIFTIFTLVLIIMAVPLTVYLVRKTQVFRSRAQFVPKAQFLDPNGNPLPQTSDGIAIASSQNVKLKIVKAEAAPATSSTPPPPPVVSTPSPSATTPCPTLSNIPADTIDTLSYFCSHHRNQGLDGEHETGSLIDFINGHAMNQDLNGQTIHYVKWNGKTFEKYTWDDEFIYLQEDHNGFGDGRAYGFSPGRWLARKMKVGDKVTVSSNIKKQFDESCRLTAQQSYPIEITLEQRIPEYDLGGVLGKQDVIVVKYDSSLNLSTGIYERFYYSKDWGWVRWEEYSKSRITDGGSTEGVLTNRRTFNKILTNPILPDKGAACIN